MKNILDLVKYIVVSKQEKKTGICLLVASKQAKF